MTTETTEMDRARTALAAADQAMGEAGAARGAAESSVAAAEADLARAGQAYADLVNRAGEGEPIQPNELLAALDAEKQAHVARDVADAVLAAVTGRYHRAWLAWLQSHARVVQHEMRAAVAVRVEAAKVAAEKIADAERALAEFHATETRVRSALFAGSDHDLQVQHAAGNNSALLDLHRSLQPWSRLPPVKQHAAYRLLVVRDNEDGRKFRNQPGANAVIVGAPIGSVEADAWTSAGLPNPEPVPAPAEAAA